MLFRSRHTTLRWATSGITGRSSYRSLRPFSSPVTKLGSKDEHKQCLSRFWIPTGGVTSALDGKQDDATALLTKAGFIRQAHSGVYHYLPPAVYTEERLQNKLETFLDTFLGASQVSLSSLSSEELWRRSGRIGEQPLEEVEHQFLRVRDRKDSHLILSPTHEEEITTLVADNARSYKDFPLRLYQIGRKYRDELRPRHGLLRTKEFLMKDMYTFDTSEEAAIETYDKVREVYRDFFKSLGVPVVEAKASSGDMGGDLSHEFHILSASGEDTIHICQSCGFAENEEVTSKPKHVQINDHACPQCSSRSMSSHNAIEVGHTFHLGTRYSEPLNAMVEIPTLATADSGNGSVALPKASRASQRVPLQMGCHGIGLSRLVGAAASLFADGKGLRWPLHFFPMTAIVIVEGNGKATPGVQSILRALKECHGDGTPHSWPFMSVWLDDRANKSFSWKLKDAELVGYPLTIVLGRNWMEKGEYEIKCRSAPELGTKSRHLVTPVLDILNALDPRSSDTVKETPLYNASPHGFQHELAAARECPGMQPYLSEIEPRLSKVASPTPSAIWP